MKRYLLFAGWNYYPGGGWEDFQGSFETIEDAENAMTRENDWHHIVDIQTSEMVRDTTQ